MFKKLRYLSVLLIGFAVFLTACKNPYENMNLTVSHSEVVLYLKDDVELPQNNDGNDLDDDSQNQDDELPEVEDDLYPSTIEISATVSGVESNINTGVIFSQTGNAVKIENIVKTGGTTKATLSALNSGRSYIDVITREGNKKHRITVTVYKALKSIEFIEQGLAVSETAPLNLNEFVKFNPTDTNQKQLVFYINDLENVVAFNSSGQAIETTYAKLTNGILTIKNPALVPYDPVKQINFVPIVAYSTINAEISAEINVPVINLITESDIKLFITNAGSEQQIVLNKNLFGEYEINLGANITYDENVYMRSLSFMMGENILIDRFYRVSLVPMTQSERQIIDVVEKTNHNKRIIYASGGNISNFNYNRYEISQISKGSVLLNFNIDYYGLEGKFTMPVKVRVNVKDYPTEIQVKDKNNQNIENDQNVAIYNAYGVGVHGEYLRILALPEIENVYFTLQAENASNLIIKNQNGVVVNPANSFSSGTVLYLSHNYTDNLPQDAKLKIIFTYSLAPNNASEGYTVYALEHVINLDFKIGLTDLTVPPQMTINVVNKKLITATGGENDEIVLASAINTTVSLADAITKIEIISFNDVNVVNIPNFDLDPISNIYYSIDFNTIQNKVFIVPNNNGLSARFKLRITTNNLLVRESVVNLFVPLAFNDALTPYIEMLDPDNSAYQIKTRGYNVTLDNSNLFEIKLAKDESNNRYDSEGNIVDGINGNPLDITYLTTTSVNTTTNSSLYFNFYNYLVDFSTQTPSIYKVNYNSNVTISTNPDYYNIENDPVSGAKVLRIKTLTTPVSGIDVNINFNGYNNVGEFRVIQFKFKLFITRPINSISISPSSANIYETSSLGALNEAGGRVDFGVSSNPVMNLTPANNITVSYHLHQEVVYNYTIQMSPSQTITIGGTTYNIINYIRNYASTHNKTYLTITDDGLLTISFYSTDLGTLTQTNQSATLVATLTSGENSFYEKVDLIYKIRYGLDLTETVNTPQDNVIEIINNVFSRNIKVVVYVTVQHFNKLPISAYSEVTISRAVQVENIILNNVNLQDGIYFDNRDGQDTRTISVTVLPQNASNKKLVVSVLNNTVAIITSGVDSQGYVTGNTFTIKRAGAGTTTLVIASQDSYMRFTENGQTVIKPRDTLQIRIKSADGTKENPYEIRTTEEFLRIGTSNPSFHYVLARDINLTGINFTPFKNFNGGLNGLFTYFNTGIYYSVQHTIYGLNIARNLTIENQTNPTNYENYNFGLFENLQSNAVLENIYVKNATINLNIEKQVAEQNNTDYIGIINVGIIAGNSSANIINPQVVGSINITSNVNNINVGGIVGAQNSYFNTANSTLKGYIVSDELETSKTFSGGLNTQVSIKLVSPKNVSTTSTNSIGGVVGKLTGNSNVLEFTLLQMIAENLETVTRNIENISSQSNINVVYVDGGAEHLNTANVGGIVGSVENAIINNTLTTPYIRAYSNVGGVAGVAINAFITNTIVQFYDQAQTGLNQTNLIATQNLGGLVGVGQGITIDYSYVRNYINKSVDQANYFGNILLLNGETNEISQNAVSQVYVGGLVGFMRNAFEITNLYVHTISGSLVEASVSPGAEYELFVERTTSNLINRSYFNATINTFAEQNALFTPINAVVNAGGLVGGIEEFTNALSIENSYVNATILLKETTQNESEWVELTEELILGEVTYKSYETITYTNEEENLVEIKTPILVIQTVRKINTRIVTVGEEEIVEILVETTTLKQHMFGSYVGNTERRVVTTTVLDENEDETNVKRVEFGANYAGVIIKTSYASINKNLNTRMFVVNQNNAGWINELVQTYELTITPADENQNEYNYTSAYLSIFETPTLELFKDDYGFNIVHHTEIGDLDTVFVLYDGINDDLPVLKARIGNVLLYKVLPSSFEGNVIDFNLNGNPFNNLAYKKVANNKVVLFYNRLTFGTSHPNNNKYKIISSLDTLETGSINNVIRVDLNINLNQNSAYRPEIDGNLVIESSNSLVVRVLAGGIIETLSQGQATLTIYARLNKSIYTTIDVLVVNGISGINISSGNQTYSTYLNVDSTSFYSVEKLNQYTSVPYYATFETNSNIGYIVEPSLANKAQVMLNNELLENGEKYVYSSLTEFNLKGVVKGTFEVKITPVILTNLAGFGSTISGINGSLTNAIEINELSINRSFEVIGKTRTIHLNNKHSATISPAQSTTATVTIITSTFDEETYKANGNTFDELTPKLFNELLREKLRVFVYDSRTNLLLASFENILDINENATITSEYLLEIEYNGFTYENVYNRTDVVEIIINFNFTFRFDVEKFAQTHNGQTHNLNNQYYLIRFIPTSNQTISTQFMLDIVPTGLSKITSKFYAGNEHTVVGGSYVFNPNEAETDYIAPGRYGLLKIYLSPEYNDAEYVEVTINQSHRNYITLSQLLENRNSDDQIIGYVPATLSPLELPNGEGIRLRNSSIAGNPQVQNSVERYNGSLFVRVGLSALTPINSTVVVTVTAYKTVNGNRVELPHKQTLNLTVQPLPSVVLSYNGSDSGIVAIGKEIELTLQAYNIDGTPILSVITTKSSPTEVEAEYNPLTDKYFLRVSDNATLGDEITVTARVYRVINGVEELSESSIKIKVVEFIIESVYLNGASNINGQNAFEILNGTSNELSVSINANYSKTALNGQIETNKIAFENLISGKGLISSGIEANNNWRLQRVVNGVLTYATLAHDTLYPSVSDAVFRFSRVSSNDFTQTSYYAVSGLRVSNGTYTLAFMASYYYDEFGRVQQYTGNESNVTVISIPTYVFNLVIKDNSTYDHPNPISTVEEFNNMQEGVHYILVSDITLNNHTPFEAKFASLDGNGYVININSFNMSKYASQSTVTTGIFESISNNSVLKNITINVGGLLITKEETTQLINGVALNAKINLSNKQNVIFGILAGSNSGTITNAKIVNLDNASTLNTDKFMYVHTTQNFIDGAEALAQIGGIVGTNSGSISNSFIGQNYYTINKLQETENGLTYGDSTIKRVVNDQIYNNAKTYNFTLAGGKQIAGVAFSNSGTISNTYVKEISIINVSTIFTNTKTAGFVVNNSGYIYNAFVEGGDVINYRSSGNVYLEAKGFIGGFVYSNSGTIAEAYSNISINTNSGGSGGFVYINESNGLIRNAYSAGNNNAINSWSHGLFTGISSTNEINNYGKYESAFYLIYTNEAPFDNSAEPAQAVIGDPNAEEGYNPFIEESSFSTFSFTSNNQTENGIWIMNAENPHYGPQLVNSLTYDTFSFRRNVSTTPDPQNPQSVIHNYEYIGDNYKYGSANNPVLINTKDEFLNVIISNSKTFTYNGAVMNVFGVKGSAIGGTSEISHLRLVNNLSFAGEVLNNFVISGKRISDITFAGVLDGNGMSMTGISLVDLNQQQNSENYGFFNQIGISNYQYRYFLRGDVTKKNTLVTPTIKNITISIGGFEATNAVKVGALAGTIYDSNLINVTLRGSNNVIIQGRNLVGGFAGLIQFETPNDSTTGQAFSLINLNADNIRVTSSYRSVTDNEELFSLSEHGVITKLVGITPTVVKYGNYYHDQSGNNPILNMSYAGAISGVIVGNNRLESEKTANIQQDLLGDKAGSANQDITKHRTYVSGKITNITNTGGTRIVAEHSGGLFGFVSENTHIKQSGLIISNAANASHLISGSNYAGGVVGENYGFLEKVYIKHTDSVQDVYNETLTSTTPSPVGITTLFGNNHSVAIGGIAGYTDNSIILDSYVLVNVINQKAFIAGGVVGLATRKNYISHTYVANDVFAKAVVGGVVGLYNQSGKGITSQRNLVSPTSVSGADDYKLFMDYVVALNTWGTNARNAQATYIREFYRRASQSGTAYYNYNLILSEIGNLSPVVNLSGYTSEQITAYLTNLTQLTPTTQIGSLMGRVVINTLDENDHFKYIHNGVSYQNTKLLVAEKQVETKIYGKATNGSSESLLTTVVLPITPTLSLIKQLYGSSYYKISSINTTLSSVKGVYKAVENARQVALSGQVSYIPTVVSTTFTGANVVTNTNPNRTNIYPSESAPNGRGDIISWPSYNVENSASLVEYVSGTIGRQHFNYDVIGKAENSRNYFESWTVDDENANISDVAMNYQSKVWKVSEKTYVLPEYIIGIHSNYTRINTLQGLYDLINNNNTSTQYYILERNKDAGSDGNYSFTNMGGNELFIHGFNGVLIGQPENVGGVSVNPKIIINFVDTNTISTVFKTLSGATISNVDFELNFTIGVSGYRLLNNNIATPSKNAGLIAKDVVNSVISNVNVTINSNQAVTEFRTANNSIENFGLLFGEIYNGNLSNISLYVKTSILINPTTYEPPFNQNRVNYIGGFAGIITDTNISNTNIYGYGNTLSINTNNISLSQNLYVGGVVGYIGRNSINSKLSNVNTLSIVTSGLINNSTLEVRVLGAHANTKVYVGGVVGYAYALTANGVAYYGDLIVGENPTTPTIKNDSFVGGIVGYIETNSDLQNLYVNSYYNASSNYVKVLKSGTSHSISVVSSGATVVGGLVGRSYNTTIGTVGEKENTNNSSNIVVNGNYNNKHVRIGGIVGNYILQHGVTETSSIGIFKAFNAGNITYSPINVNATSAYIGGIAGYAEGVYVNEVYSYGNITFDSAKAFAVGQIVGYITNKNSRIQNFIVYGDITYNSTQRIGQNQYIAGVVGRINSGLVIFANGLSLARLNNIFVKDTTEIANVNGIANGLIQTIDRTYFVYEFLPINSNISSHLQKTFISYNGLQNLNLNTEDSRTRLLAGISDYKEVLPRNNKLGVDFVYNTSIPNVEINIPRLQRVINIQQVDSQSGNKLFSVGGKLNPIKIIASASNSQNNINSMFNSANSNKYFRIDHNYSSNKVVPVNTDTISISEFNGFITGSEYQGEYNILQVTNASAKTLVDNNKGIIANLSISISTLSNPLYRTAFVANANNGFIYNVVSLGAIKGSEDSTEVEFAGLVYTNNSIIANAGTSHIIEKKYTNTVAKISALVFINNGIVHESYSTTSILPDTFGAGFVGLVYTNNGYLGSSYYGGSVSINFGSNNPLIKNTAQGKVNHLAFDKSSIKSSNAFGINRSDFNSWMTATASGKRITNAFIASAWNQNFGYPIIVNGVKINSRVQISTTSTDVTNIYYYSENANASIAFSSGSLYNAINNETSNIVLVADISFNGYINSNGTQIFNASLNSRSNFGFYGMNHKISGLKLSDSLFNNLSNSIVSNVEFDGLVLYSTKATASLGVIAKLVEGGEINDVKINNSIIFASNSSYVGAIAGQLNSNIYISNSEVASTTIIGTRFVGGLIGYTSKVYLTSNKVLNSNIFGNSSTSHYIGGVVGYAESIYSTGITSENNNVNSSNINISHFGINDIFGVSINNVVTANSNHNIIGGVFGQVVDSYLTTVIASSYVRGKDQVGGVAGNSVDTKYTDQIGGLAGDTNTIIGSTRVGGIIGFSVSDTIGINSFEYNNKHKVVNYASVGAIGLPKSNEYEDIGGVVGAFADSTINNARNEGQVYGSKYVGGIIGRMSITSKPSPTYLSNYGDLVYTGVADIDNDDGTRYIKIAAHDSFGIVDGKQDDYTHFGIVFRGSINNPNILLADPNINTGKEVYHNGSSKWYSIEFGGLDRSIWKKQNTNYTVYMGLIIGFKPNNVNPTNVYNDSSSLIKGLFDKYVKYSYKDFSETYLYSKSALIMFQFTAQSGIRYYSGNGNLWLYGGQKTKVDTSLDNELRNVDIYLDSSNNVYSRIEVKYSTFASLKINNTALIEHEAVLNTFDYPGMIYDSVNSKVGTEKTIHSEITSVASSGWGNPSEADIMNHIKNIKILAYIYTNP